MPAPTPFLTAADVARILGVTPATVRLMAKRGALVPAMTTASGMRLFRGEDVDALAQARAAQKSPAPVLR